MLTLCKDMDESASLDVETLKITQEQYILDARAGHHQRPSCDPVYPVGLYGWRKRCLYFFLLLLLTVMIVNMALTVWIIKVMRFTVDGMGNLRMNQESIHLEGISEFLFPFYVKEIQSRRDSPLVLRSNRNVTVNARNIQGHLTGQLTVGPDALEAQCQRFQVRSMDGEKVLFSVDEEEISIGTDHLRVTEGAVFGRSVETPLIQADGSQDLKLESPTRTVTMEAPRGVEISAAKGKLKATCRKDLELRSTEGEIVLDANTIRLGRLLPLGVYSPDPAPRRHTVYELCVCPNGRLYLSPAESSSTCHSMSHVCLWS
ncbi:zeta-sarcoglycan isoform X2 [Esox lucius]|uniref:zeta-sarcoglycan isoform X2 n=1 Tax=Esox lucius TaxID=8010 RepID=UPI000577E298|nr:zeta-sarcoglycan isoform X2 [Esox lucius]